MENAHKTVQDRFIYHFQFSVQGTFFRFKMKFMYSSSKKKRNTPIYFSANYRREMKLVPIIMNYCLL